MFGSETMFIAAIVGGFAFLFARDAVRRRRQLGAAERRGLEPGSSGLAALAAHLRASVLFHVADGGHEQGVLEGQLALPSPGRDAAPERARVTVFDLTFQRDVRGEWGYLACAPSFRIFSPLTVAAFELPPALVGDSSNQLLIKRRGRAEAVAEEGWERYKSAADVVRDVSTIERAIPVPPPGALPKNAQRLGALGRDYLAWAADPAAAAALLDRELCACLDRPSVLGRELVIELVGPLVLVYVAKDGALSGADADAFVDLAKDLCRQLARALERAQDPRAPEDRAPEPDTEPDPETRGGPS